ncbi:MAG: HAD-IA family hydrolase [Bacteriovorax sp.]|jgi:phosphoglycolate phosphatase-like HAD superfamily hydrolase
MGPKEILSPVGHIVFDHDGTLVNTEVYPYRIFEGMRDLIVELKSKKFEIYVWTSRGRSSTLESLKTFNIESFFTQIYCYDDGPPKPDPMGLAHLTSGMPKNKILHIGDSITDLQGAKAYGIEVVLACWNHPDQVEKYSELADYIALNLIELREIIKGKFNV